MSYRPFPLSSSQEQWLTAHDDAFKQLKEKQEIKLAYKDIEIVCLKQERDTIQQETELAMKEKAFQQQARDLQTFRWTLAGVVFLCTMLGMKLADAYYFGW